MIIVRFIVLHFRSLGSPASLFFPTLQLRTSLGILHRLLDHALQLSAVNLSDIVDETDIRRRKSLLVGVDVSVARAGIRNIDVKVNCPSSASSTLQKTADLLTLRAVGDNAGVQDDGRSRLVPERELGAVVVEHEVRVDVLHLVHLVEELLRRHDLVGDVAGNRDVGKVGRQRDLRRLGVHNEVDLRGC